MRRARALVPLLAACLSACGGQPRSEVVIVVDSDYSTDPKMLELDTISILVSGGGYVADPPGEGAWSFGALGQSALALPVSLGLWAGTDDGFTVDVTAAARYLGTNLVQRSASGVRSARGERRTLALPLLRKCACQGTNCPADPECRTLIEPVLQPFDES